MSTSKSKDGKTERGSAMIISVLVTAILSLLGISYLLIDLYGAPKGSIGLYGAIYPLGLEWKVSRVFLLIINPLGIAIPVPQLQGVPLTYPQYRFSIGLGILAG